MTFLFKALEWLFVAIGVISAFAGAYGIAGTAGTSIGALFGAFDFDDIKKHILLALGAGIVFVICGTAVDMLIPLL